MHSVQAGMWDPRPPSKHASPLPQPLDPNSRPTHVTAATPAKRITFYKSGDNQFGGIRMAVHKRSFKCFDALLDDLSQKMPLPFGVRTVTTPRGTHTINHLEQLQDGGCYLCSDRRHTKPVNMELAGKHPNIWYHHSHRPHRPESMSTSPHGHLPYRQRRILLVKNSEPGIRRSVVLSRRSARSMRAFLDEVSEMMQFHVRKLYTAEGRRIDSVQSLMTCPGVLVCVGREAFSPTLVNFIRKSSEEKLPGLGSRSSGLGPRTPGNGARSPVTQGARSPLHGAQSRASEYSDGHESKKNVNFGLETKKSIIHPRSDSSNRSARFSLSSDKSYGVGTDPQSRPAIMNEDIEKRVLVNKDGSLSVEMRVRFRLQNDEMLQWSTQIQKRPSLTNECCPLSQAQPHYLQQGQSESCSDPDSTYYDREGVDYSAQHVSDGSHCRCCYQRQEQQYDLWENPIHSHKRAPAPPPHSSSHTIMRHTHSSSSSSSCNSRRVVHCRAHLSNCGEDTGSEQSHMVQEEMCMTERVERRVEVEQNGDTHVEVCRVSRGCSRSEVVAMDSNLRPSSGKSADDELMLEEGEDCPLSTVSSSSHVLQSLREDQDDDLPPSASQCSHRNESATTFENQQTSNACDGSVQEEGGSVCHCGAGTPHSVAAGEEMEATQSCNSRISRASCRSSKSHIPASEVEGAADEEDQEIKRAISGMSGHTGLSGGSAQSRTSSVCPQCGGCKSKITSNSSSRASHRSHHSKQASPKPATPVSKQENGSEDDSGSNDSAVSTQSNKTNLTINGCCSGASNGRASSAMSTASNPEATAEEEERAPSATSARSHKSIRSHKSSCHGSISVGAGETRSPSAMSQKSNSSVTAEDHDSKSREEAEGVAERAPSALSAKSSALSDKSNVSGKLSKAERPDSVVSAKSNKSKVSVKSSKSHRSTCSQCARAVSPGVAELIVEASQQEEATEERAASTLSAKSNKSCKASEKSESPRAETEGEERVMSQMSGRSGKSNLSVHSAKSCKSNHNGSCKSHKSNCNENQEASSEGEDNTGDGEEHQERAASALSGKSDSSAKPHDSNCDTALSGASPTEDEGKSEVGSVKDRTPSAMSGKSHTSAKSSKSWKSNCTTASLNPNRANGPSTDSNGDEKQTQERVASSMSAKSKSSVRSCTSHKSKSSLKVQSLSPSVVTIKTPEDEEGNDTTEQAQSSASTKSSKSHKSGHDEVADTAVAETTDADEDNRPTSKSSQHSKSQILSHKRVASPQTHSPLASAPTGTPQSPVQQLSPGSGAGEGRGASALSVHSIKSAKSGRSKCSCGTAAANKVKKEEEEEDKEGKSEEAASILSSSSERRQRKSEGTEQPLSRTSSGSVSLGLALDTADSDSGKSGVSCHVTTEKDKTETGSMEDVEEMGSTMSKKSNNTESKSTLSQSPPAVDIPTIETPGGADDKGEESGEKNAVRTPSANSAKSNRSQKSSCSCKIKAVAETLETGSVKSSSEGEARKTHSPDNRTLSALSSKSAKVRSKSPGSASAKSSNAAKTIAEDLANNASANKADSRPASKAEEKEEVLPQSSCCLQPKLVASAPLDCLNAGKSSRAKSSSSVKTSSSQKKDKQIKSSIPCPLHTSRPGSKVETRSESTLSHSLSAADLLKETMSAARPQSQQSKASKASQKTKSKKGRGSRNQDHQEDLEELTPACLPNASPTEVVSDWLRSIPADSSMLAPGDEEEGKEKGVEENPGEETVKEEASPEDETLNAEEGAEVEEEGEKKEAAENNSSDPAPGDPVGNSYPETLLLKDEPLPRNWQSSTAVMKVLLNSSLGRCQSLPEVSPSYGRRLSTSARGFLDCLAQLQLIEPSVNPDQPKDRRYEDIMAILQSLWLTEPGDIGAKETKDSGTEQVTPPRSSSGVGMSSGSGGSGKENGNQGGDETDPTQTNEAESLHEDEGVEKVEEGSAEAGLKEAEAGPEETKESEAPPSLDSPKDTENPSSSSANDSSKSPTDNERETLEDSSSGTTPTVLRAPLSKKPSQDPDPVWILHLLKKLEKQFMNHYVDAMAEFKVRWDLDDSIILDTMISELKDEVSCRIQSSIQREMKKIQSRAGRAGKSPQPPKGSNLSRDSSTTEKRRRMLRVMKNQSVKTADSLSDGEMTGEFSDQRSDDEYCPCDACVRKKMAARPFKTNPLAAEAPVMMEFDLLKILQLKKSPSPLAAPLPQEEEECDSVFVEEESRNLDVVQEEEEEEEETKEDIQADVVLEETIPEEDEEKEEDRVEAGATEGEDSEIVDGEEQEEGETGGEGAEEEETQCQCQCAKSEEEAEGDQEEEEEEETSNNTHEDERESAAEEEGESADNEEEMGEEEGESDRETVKEATTGEGETTENAENEEEEVVEKEEEEEETAGQESAEEEPLRETTEGNASHEAEEGDEGEGGVSAREEESYEEENGGENEEQAREASEEERATPQRVTEGEEADAEDSDNDNKRPSDTSCDESGRDGAEATGEEEKEGGDEEEEEKEEEEDAAEESKPEEEEEEEEANTDKKEDGALPHQFTKTSVESQPGSLEDIDTDSPPNPVNSIEVPKMGGGVSGGGGGGQRRSRSPARVKRHKPKGSDAEMDDF